MVFGIMFGIPVLVLGWIVLYAGVNQYRTKALIEDTPTSAVRSLALGRVEVKGRPEPAETAYRAPVSNEECVFYRYHVDKWSDSSRGAGNWLPVEVGTKPTPFYLNDGTGRVLVDPAGAELHVRRETYEFDEGETESEAVRSFVAERDDRFETTESLSGLTSTVPDFMGERDVREVGEFDMAAGAADIVGNESRRRRYVAEYLPVDEDEVYVFGHAAAREGVSSADNAENVVVRDDDSLPAFSISSRSEDALADKIGRNVLVTLGSGAGFATVGFVILLLTAGGVVGFLIALFFTPISLGLAWALDQVIDIGKSRVRLGTH